MIDFDLQRFNYERDMEETRYRGRRRWSGNFGRVWVNNSLLFEISAFEAKVTMERDDIIIGVSVDKKVTSLSGEGTITIKRVFDRGYKNYLMNQQAGYDVRFTIVATLSDPDTVRGQETRVKIQNCMLNELPIIHFAKGEVVEDELPFSFTPSDVTYINTVKLADYDVQWDNENLY